MDSNQSSVLTGVSSTERFADPCSHLADPCSRRVRRQRSLPSYPSMQFSRVPVAREENIIMKKPLVSLTAVGSITDHQVKENWRR